MIKLIASDLDGTLLTSSKQLSRRLSQILKRASDKGVIFVPATGRTLCAVPDYVKELPFTNYIITSNGACVYKSGSKTPIFMECLKPEHAETVFNEASRLNVITEVFANGMAYISKAHAENLEAFGITGRRANYIKTTRTAVDDLNSLLASNIGSIENMNIIFTDMSLRERFRNEMKARLDVFVTSSSTDNIEISSTNAAKGNALRKLCQRLGIDKSETIAFGDSENDLDMLEFAGTGIVMENAAPELKSGRFTVTASCDSDGVAKILEGLFN